MLVQFPCCYFFGSLPCTSELRAVLRQRNGHPRNNQHVDFGLSVARVDLRVFSISCFFIFSLSHSVSTRPTPISSEQRGIPDSYLFQPDYDCDRRVRRHHSRDPPGPLCGSGRRNRGTVLSGDPGRAAGRNTDQSTASQKASPQTDDHGTKQSPARTDDFDYRAVVILDRKGCIGAAPTVPKRRDIAFEIMAALSNRGIALILALWLGAAIGPSAARAAGGNSTNQAQSDLVNQANAPISSVFQIRTQDSYAPAFQGRLHGQGNSFLVSLTMPLPEYRLLPLPQLSLLTIPIAITLPLRNDYLTAFGDVRFLDLAVLDAGHHLLVGVGPTFIFSSANTKKTGQGKWQAGPAAATAFVPGKWLLGY